MNQGASFIFIALMFGFFYFLIIRPQRKRMNDLQALQRSLELGDEVVTIGGFHGEIVGLADDTVEVEIAPGVVVTLARNAIARTLTVPAAVMDDEAFDDSTFDDTTFDQTSLDDGATGPAGDDLDDGRDGR